MRTYLLVGIAGVVIAGIPVFISCGSDEQPPRAPVYVNPSGNTIGKDGGTTQLDVCSVPGHPGCPCSDPGAVSDCGMIDYISGDYVTCVMGQSVCDSAVWGPCTGNRIVAQSLRGHALTPAGKRLLATTSQDCVTPCDPRCVQVTGQTTDIDAGSLTITDAGVTLTQTVGAGPGSGPCKGLWCNVDACPSQPKTSVSGIVYDPAGKVPLYNAYVYIPVDPTLALPAFTTGVSCDTCAGATDVSAVAVAQTGPDGKFTLNNVPYGDGIVPLVVQMGKWRRKITLPSIQRCQDNPIAPAYTRLPRNRTDGDGNQADIPRMAIASGDADPFECLLLKAGIDPAEIDVPSKNPRIDYYRYNGADRYPGGAPTGVTLTGSLDTLKKYDVVLLPCEGAENAHNTQAPNIVSYANLGGRMFTTHYGYVWLATPSSKNVASNLTPFYGTANWKLGLSDYSDPTTATIDQTFPKGVAFAQWLQNVGATTTLGRPSINEPRHNALTVISPSQRWVYGATSNSTVSYRDMLLAMTFNTPIGVEATKQCGRVVFSDFHVSADALVGNTTTCSSDTDCGVTATCSAATSGTCAPKACTPSTTCAAGYTCTGAAQGSCTTQACTASSQCGTGRTCTGGKQGTCGAACYQKSDCGTHSWDACIGGAIGSCSAATCKATADCGTGTCSGATIGSCVPATKSCWVDGDCTSLNALATCGGEQTGTCSTACTSNTDCGGSTCSSATHGTCRLPAPNSCTRTSECTSKNAAATCGGVTLGSCSTATCKVNSDCTYGTCVGAKSWKNGTCTCAANSDCSSNNCVGEAAGVCGVPTSSCWADSTCATTYGTGATCTGAVTGTCPPKTGCKADVDCGGTRVCNGESAGTCTGPLKTCWDTSDCSSLGSQYSCQSATIGSCTASSCKLDSECGTGRTCSGEAQGYCSSNRNWSCTDDSGCWGSDACIGTVSGTCAAGSCYANADCGSSGSCTAGTVGACQKACTTSATCGSLACVSGLCQGCLADSACTSGTCVGDIPRTCSASSSMFPLSCRNGNLSGQEKALEFMLFDLSACVSPDSWAPPVPSVSYSPITFTLDFPSSCGASELPVWREFDWKAELPTGTSIVFSAQTADRLADYATAQSAPLATATTSTVLPGWDVAIIDTTTTGAFQSADPRIASLATLRVTVTLNPSADKKAAPTLNAWQVAYDCLDRQ